MIGEASLPGPGNPQLDPPFRRESESSYLICLLPNGANAVESLGDKQANSNGDAMPLSKNSLACAAAERDSTLNCRVNGLLNCDCMIR